MLSRSGLDKDGARGRRGCRSDAQRSPSNSSVGAPPDAAAAARVSTRRAASSNSHGHRSPPRPDVSPIETRHFWETVDALLDGPVIIGQRPPAKGRDRRDES